MTQEKFKNKYRIKSARNPNWDYSSAGAYFVTICTANHECYFGEIVGANIVVGTQCIASLPQYPKLLQYKMQLTEIGQIAQNEWLKTPVIRPDMNILLDEFIVMPNHFHGIIIFMETATTNQYRPNKFGPQSKNLGSVIRGFKSAIKTYATIHNIEFAWQSRFHDRIIRDEAEFYRIKNYIRNNPSNWRNDEYTR